MNAAGDFRYVTPGGFRDFDDVPNLDLRRGNAPERGARASPRSSPGGPYAKLAATRWSRSSATPCSRTPASCRRLGDARSTSVNRAARCWLDGQASGTPPPALDADDGPVWTRAYGCRGVDCATLDAALDGLHVKRMVVGHTVQEHGITRGCDGGLWRIDVGLAKRYSGPMRCSRSWPELKVLSGTASDYLSIPISAPALLAPVGSPAARLGTSSAAPTPPAAA